MLILIKSWRERAQRKHWGQGGDSCDRNSCESWRDATTQIPNSSMQTALNIWCLHLPQSNRLFWRKNGQDLLSPTGNAAGWCLSYSFTLFSLWDLRRLKIILKIRASTKFILKIQIQVTQFWQLILFSTWLLLFAWEPSFWSTLKQECYKSGTLLLFYYCCCYYYY